MFAPENPAFPVPSLTSGHDTLDKAFRVAIGDIVGNCIPFKDGLLEQRKISLMAGLDYDTPWTRDAAINTWNGAGLLFPNITRNTMLSVLERQGNEVRIGGQYWDAIIWAIGAWAHYLYTGDIEFLTVAFDAVRHSLAYFEATEFDSQRNLFRGPACYGDGVAAYPDIYAQTNDNSSILVWPAQNPALASHPGYGLPMHALSTNCLYYEAYVILEHMAGELGQPVELEWQRKAQALKEAINQHFWNADTGHYRYLVDDFGNSDAQEGMGHSFALLFGIADEEKSAAILQNQYISPHGIPCVWPNFERYASKDGMSFGRHSGTIWPHIQAFWAQAVQRCRRFDLFEHELQSLAGKLCRDSQCAEIYHPLTGEIYGGVQEGNQGKLWKSCSRQTWSATGYLRMILMGLLGMEFTSSGITFRPYIPEGIELLQLTNLPYRNMILDIQILGDGTLIEECTFDGSVVLDASISADEEGKHSIRIKMA